MYWHFQSLCDNDGSSFSRNLKFFGRNTGPRFPGAPGLSPASPIVNLGLGTCSTIGMLKGYMVRERLGTPGLGEQQA